MTGLRDEARESAEKWFNGIGYHPTMVTMVDPLTTLLLEWHRRGEEDMRERAAVECETGCPKGSNFRRELWLSRAAEAIRDLPVGRETEAEC